MKRIVLFSLAFLFALCGTAQKARTNYAGNNSMLEVEMHDLEYYRPLQLNDYILLTANRTGHNSTAQERRFRNLRYENIVSSINETVKSAFTDVNRFQCTTLLSSENQGLQFSGVVTNISLTSKQKAMEEKDKDGRTRKFFETIYNGRISVSLTLTNKQNRYFDSHKFERTSFNHSSELAPDEVLHDLIRGLQYEITQYYNELYPLHAEIIECAEVTKGKVKKLYLNVGKYFEVREGQHFDIFTLGKVAEHTTYTKIGRVKVDEVRGTDICLCDVQKGSKDIKEAIDHQEKIIAISD